MARLTLDQGIPRFKDNEERIDIMTNGDEDAEWQTANGIMLKNNNTSRRVFMIFMIA